MKFFVPLEKKCRDTGNWHIPFKWSCWRWTPVSLSDFLRFIANICDPRETWFAYNVSLQFNFPWSVLCILCKESTRINERKRNSTSLVWRGMLENMDSFLLTSTWCWHNRLWQRDHALQAGFNETQMEEISKYMIENWTQGEHNQIKRRRYAISKIWGVLFCWTVVEKLTGWTALLYGLENKTKRINLQFRICSHSLHFRHCRSRPLN